MGSSERPKVDVTDDPEAGRYHASVDGREAGYAAYRMRRGRIEFTHTQVGDEWEGQGVGSALARGALDDAVAKGLAIVPSCPFMVSYIHRHHEYVAHLDPVSQGMFADD
jgi:predicted GNAT family acetyltransferase